MYEELFLAIAVVVIILIVVIYSFLKNRVTESELNLHILDTKGRLAIAERKFMQGKIRKGIFEMLVSQLEEELLTAELALFRLQKAPSVEVSPKAKTIIAVMDKPTKYRRAKITFILKETELLRHEMSLLEAKLLKRQIREGVFEKLIAQKEAKLIAKEKELSDIVKNDKNQVLGAGPENKLSS